jgi:branched-chain amino acid transport system substrate-binding protein
VRTFISDPSVLAFVGPANSSVAKAEIPLSNEAGLVEIAASTTADGLTRGPDAAKLRVAHPDVNSFFRLSTLDSRQGAAGASFARKLGLAKAFVIDDNETYGKGRAQILKYVAETKDIPTPVGEIGFDKFGDTTAPILSLYEVKSSKAKFVSQIDLKN